MAMHSLSVELPELRGTVTYYDLSETDPSVEVDVVPEWTPMERLAQTIAANVRAAAANGGPRKVCINMQRRWPDGTVEADVVTTVDFETAHALAGAVHHIEDALYC